MSRKQCYSLKCKINEEHYTDNPECITQLRKKEICQNCKKRYAEKDFKKVRMCTICWRETKLYIISHL